MNDQIIVNHAERLTALEISMSGVLARLDRMDKAAQQAASDKQQAEWREMGDLRRQLTEAEAKLKELAPPPADDAKPTE